LAGFLAGDLLAHRIGQSIFGSAIQVHPVVLLLVLTMALLVTLLASIGPLRTAIHFDPAVVLRGDA
jgi:ABC-type lipoprotein release transport system permease subunit